MPRKKQILSQPLGSGQTGPFSPSGAYANPIPFTYDPTTFDQCDILGQLGYNPLDGKAWIAVQNVGGTTNWLNIGGGSGTFTTITVTGNATIGGTLGVTGLTTLGTLTQVGAASFTGTSTFASAAATTPAISVGVGSIQVTPTTVAAGASPLVSNNRFGQVTFSGVSIAAAAVQSFVITNSTVTGSGTNIMMTMSGATTGSALTIQSVTPSASSISIVVTNGTGASTTTANIQFTYWVMD